MVFMFCDDASKQTIKLRGDEFRYIIKVRRHNVGDEIDFRNKTNISMLYTYKLISIGNRDAIFELISQKEHIVKPHKYLHVAWCLIDPKSIEKVVPILCEIGVSRISFITCDRTQKNFKLDFKRLQRLQESSMQQNGRSEFIEFDTYKDIKEFLSKFPDTKVFDFCENICDDFSNTDRIMIGCEGGFSKNEKEFLKDFDVFALKTPFVLRSQNAVVAIASKILL